MSEEIILDLKHNYVKATINKNGVREEKDILYNNLANIFAENEQVLQTEWLPGEYGIQRILIKNNNSHYFYLEPPRKVNVKYEHPVKPSFRKDYYTKEEWGIEKLKDESEEDFTERLREVFNRKVEQDKVEGKYVHRLQFMTPRLLWSVPLFSRRGQLTDSGETKVFAMKHSIITGNEPLFKVPFSNVYDTQRICWGHTSINIPNVKAIQGLSNTFFNAPFNRDLEGGKVSTIRFENSNGDFINSSDFFVLALKTTQMFEEGKSEVEVLSFVEDVLLSHRQTPNELVENVLAHL